MGKAFDKTGISFRPETWAAFLPHLHPGAFGMAFASSRGWHRLACAIEDAGYVIHPSIFGWCTGQSFPKATRVGDAANQFCECDCSPRQFALHGGQCSASDGLGTAEDSQNDCQESDRSDDAPLQHDTGNGQDAGLPPNDVQERIHSGGPSKRTRQGSVPYDTPSPVQCTNLHANRDSTSRVDAQTSTFDGKASSRTSFCRTANDDGSRVSRKSSKVESLSCGNYSAGFPLCQCQRCGKPKNPFAGHRYGLQSLKNALEPIIVFQAPYSGRPVDCITKTGAGALNVDGGRIATTQDERDWMKATARPNMATSGWGSNMGTRMVASAGFDPSPLGRWPANFALLDEQAAAALDRQSGERPSGTWNKTAGMRPFNNNGEDTGYETIDGIRDSGGASRFFFRVTERLDQADPVMYCAKASRGEREAGLDGMELKGGHLASAEGGGGGWAADAEKNPNIPRANHHPTVKPLQLTRWLATLLLPPPEYFPRRIVIPFAGVMSEGIGASQAGWDEIVGVEREAEYVEIGRARYEHWCKSATTKQLELAEAV